MVAVVVEVEEVVVAATAAGEAAGAAALDADLEAEWVGSDAHTIGETRHHRKFNQS